MIKIIITTIILFIIFIIILLSFNVKIEYFSNTFITKNYILLKDNNNNIINPIVWYKFDSDNINKDDINNNNNLIFNNGSISNDFVKGNKITGGSLYLGNGTYAKMPINNINLNKINKINGISFTFWGKFNNSSGTWSRIFDFGMKSINIPSHGSRSILIARYAYFNSLIFYISSRNPCCPGYEDSGYAIIDNENYFDGNWRNYTWTLSNNGNWNIYINGVKIIKFWNYNTNRIIPEFNNNNYYHNYFGKSLYDNDGYLNGNLDDFRIYDRVLTEDQIFELYYGYKKDNQIIDSSINCSVNNNPSGMISQVPDTNMNISIISKITKINENIYNQSFGNGILTYTITFSKYFNDNYIPTNLFLRNNKLTAFAIDNYNNGIFEGNGILSNYTEKGEFIHIILPSDMIIKRYGFRADENAVYRAPGSWTLYTGSRLLENTNVTKELLVNNSMKLDNNSYCKTNLYTYIHDIQNNKISGKELLFIFPSLAGSGNVLSFMELLLFS